jgi:hypothetical protein
MKAARTSAGGRYETWLRRKAAYEGQLKEHSLADTLRMQPAY